MLRPLDDIKEACSEGRAIYLHPADWALARRQADAEFKRRVCIITDLDSLRNEIVASLDGAPVRVSKLVPKGYTYEPDLMATALPPIEVIQPRYLHRFSERRTIWEVIGGEDEL
jgi:hypothetical protein